MSHSPANTFAQHRNWSIESVNFDRYCALDRGWRTSTETIRQLRLAFNSSPPRHIATIAVAGSLGRMEASGLSDCDLIVVGEQDASPEQLIQTMDSIRTIPVTLGLENPNPRGVFADPTTEGALTAKAGASDEPMKTFAKRLLILLEAQPIYNEGRFTQITNDIIARYAKGYIQQDSSKEWTFLINDLIRYFRGICVDYQWTFDSDHSKWPIRNIKLRHSRLVMYGGLLALLGEASKERKGKVEWLTPLLHLTPLERLAWVYEKNQDWNFQRVAGLYDVFLARLSHENVRDSLKKGSQNDDYNTRFQQEEYRTLKANSDALVAELLRFIMARRGAWSERFFEYLIF